MKIAIIGASGAVGQELLRLIEERALPVDTLRLFGSERSAGRTYPFRGEAVSVERLGDTSDFRDVDAALVSAGAQTSLAYAPVITRHGTLMIDNSSAFRMEPDVPLVVPEVNAAEALKAPRNLVANPNCTTIQMVVALGAIQTLSPIRRVRVATYQSASGAGAAAMEELREQHVRIARGEAPEAHRFAHPLAYNLIPQIDRFDAEDYTREEWKMHYETRKILRSDLSVSATCVRVPVLRTHSECIWVETERPVSPAEARAAFSRAPGIIVQDDPASGLYPMPLGAAGRDAVYVGRIRRDGSDPCGLTFWCVADQLRKGAALNALQILEYLLAKGRFNR